MIPEREERAGGGSKAREAGRKTRRIALLKRCGLLDTDERLTVTRAMRLSDLLTAYRFVHDVYVANGYIRPQESGLRIRVFEASPRTATFVASVGGGPLGVISAVPDTPEMGLPSDIGFHRELSELRRQRRVLCEITNLAISRESRRTGAFLGLLQAGLAQCLRFGCDDMFIAVSPSHAGFYRNVLQFEPWGGRRSYSQDYEVIVEGMRMDLRAVAQRLAETDRLLGESCFLHDFFIARNRFLHLVDLWKFAAERYFLDPGTLAELFVQRAGLLQSCERSDLDALRHQWGAEIYEKVMMSGVDEAFEGASERFSAVEA